MPDATVAYEPTNLELMEILLRVLCDKRPGKADALCIHGSIGNWRIDAALLLEAAKIRHESSCGFVVINGLTAEHSAKRNIAYLGHEIWLEQLLNLGIPKEKILLTLPAENTAAESENFLLMAKERDWRVIIIESMPHHQARCFLQMVADMKRLGIYLSVFNATFPNVDWGLEVERKVLAGQNALGQKDERGAFLDLAEGELERIKKYAVPSLDWTPHATIKEALEYLNNRDAGAL